MLKSLMKICHISEEELMRSCIWNNIKFKFDMMNKMDNLHEAVVDFRYGVS